MEGAGGKSGNQKGRAVCDSALSIRGLDVDQRLVSTNITGFKIDLESVWWFIFKNGQALRFERCPGQFQGAIIHFEIVPAQKMQLFVHLQEMRIRVGQNRIRQIPDEPGN